MADRFFEITYVCGFIAGSVLRAIYTAPLRKRGSAEARGSLLEMALMLLTSVGMTI